MDPQESGQARPVRAIEPGPATLGILVHDIRDAFLAGVADAAIEAASDAGYLTVLAETHWQPDREVDYIEVLRTQGATRILLLGTRVGDTRAHAALHAEIARVRAAGGRVALVSQPEVDADTVSIRDREACRDLARALVGLGYRDFAMVAGPAKLRTSTERVEGFRDGLAESALALNPERLVRGTLDRDGGFEAGQRLMSQGRLPQCIVAVTDAMALGVLAALRAGGVRVPDDVALAGFHDIPELADVEPSLTTVRIPLEEMGREAVRLVTREPGAETVRVGVSGTVVLRASTPPRR